MGEAGGDAQVLCDAPFTSNGTWGAAGVILIEDKYRIARVPEAGGPEGGVNWPGTEPGATAGSPPWEVVGQLVPPP